MNVKKIADLEVDFICYLQKMYVKYPEWSLDIFKDIYKKFTKFLNKIGSDELSSLRTGEAILRDKNDSLKTLLKMSLDDKKWFIFNILSDSDINAQMGIILVGTICKLTIENTDDLEKLL